MACYVFYPQLVECLVFIRFHCYRYSPTILLLRHFEVFKNLGSQDGSVGDRVGVISEIASVIRELTEPVSNGEYSSMEEKSNNNSVRFAFLSLVLHCLLHSFTKVHSSVHKQLIMVLDLLPYKASFLPL